MDSVIQGKTKMGLAEADQSGNVGYSISFTYSYDPNDIDGSFSYSDVEFSGPGSWDNYACGEDYPRDRMKQHVLSEQV